MKLIYGMISLLFLTGCATYVPVTQPEVESMNLSQLCKGQKRLDTFYSADWRVVAPHMPESEEEWTLITAELKARVSKREFRQIASGQPYIGMSERILKCAMAGSYPDINVTRTKYGTSKQYVYGDVLSSKGATYVYTENGIVTTIQN